MKIPSANPIRFYKPNGTKGKDFLSFKSASEYWNELSGNYTPLFQDELNAIVYEDAISGQYGFDDTDVFTGTISNYQIINCRYAFDGGTPIYTIGASTIGKKLIIKSENLSSFVIKNGATTIDTISSPTNIYIYTLLADYADLKIEFNTASISYISGIMVVEPSIPYALCALEVDALPLDICAFGGVYKLNAYNYYLQEIDFLPIAVAFAPGTVDIIITYSDATTSLGSTDGSLDLGSKAFNAISLTEYLTYSFDTPIGIVSSKKEIASIKYEQGATRVTLTPETTYTQLDCCRFEIDEYFSEYFNILTQEDAENLKLLNIIYSSSFMDKNMAFSDLFNFSLLVNAKMVFASGADIEVFVGQQRNKPLQNFDKKLREFTSGAVPDYLVEKLELIFGFDTITINEQNFSASDNPDVEEIDNMTDLFQFTIKLRENNFDYTI